MAVVAIMLVGTPAGADRLGPARIIDVQVQGSASIITINRGSARGIAAGWRGRLVKPSGASVPHGDFTVLRVTKTSCLGKVPFSPDEISRGGYRVELDPP